MSRTTPNGKNAGRHGGARTVLCWQDKLALLDESAIIEFLARADCGCKCDCMSKIRSLGQDHAVQIIRELRTARMSGMHLNDVHVRFVPGIAGYVAEKGINAVFLFFLIARIIFHPRGVKYCVNVLSPNVAEIAACRRIFW